MFEKQKSGAIYKNINNYMNLLITDTVYYETKYNGRVIPVGLFYFLSLANFEIIIQVSF